MGSFRAKAHEIIDTISDKKLAEVIDFLEYLKVKEELEATNEIMSDENLVRAIKKGLKQAENEEIVDIKDVIEDV